MDAHLMRLALVAISLFSSTGATFRTANFSVTAPDAEIARKVGLAAEQYRRDLAVFWLKQPLPDWSRPCKLKVRPGAMGAGGETKFQFIGKEVVNWDMYVQGSVDRILDSVLPHEVNHTIFACHYRRPLPRWADEGAATLFEHRSEQLKQLGLLNQVIKSEREFIPLGRLLQLKEYPKGYRPMLIMYAEGYALADFLVQQGGRQRYLKFLADGHRLGWPRAIKDNYHHGGIESLEKNWKSWILAGMPKLKTPNPDLLADAKGGHSAVAGGTRPAIFDEYPTTATVRLQSPDSRPSTRQNGGRQKQHETPRAQPQPQAQTVVSRDSGSGYSVTSAVFRGLPINKGAYVDTSVHRQASIEAPPPKPPSRNVARQRARSTHQPAQKSSSPNISSDSFFQPGRSKRSDVESTGHLDRSDQDRRRTHLPQERSTVTGSIPQWAGFPRQKELF